MRSIGRYIVAKGEEIGIGDAVATGDDGLIRKVPTDHPNAWVPFTSAALQSSSMAITNLTDYANGMAQKGVARFIHVLYAQSAEQRYEQYKREGLRLRKDGQMDMRYRSSRFVRDYEAGDRSFGLITPSDAEPIRFKNLAEANEIYTRPEIQHANIWKP